MLVVAIVALQHPNGRVAAAGTTTRTVVQTHTVTSTPSPHNSASTSATNRSGMAGGAAGRTHGRASSTPSSAAVERLPLIVLNNTTISGLAESASQRFEAGGWTVTRYGNLTNNILSTCAYYDPSVDGARQAAQALQKQFPTIKRVKAKFPELPAGPIVVVLTPDYS